MFAVYVTENYGDSEEYVSLITEEDITELETILNREYYNNFGECCEIGIYDGITEIQIDEELQNFIDEL